MRTEWSMVKLGEVLRLDLDRVSVDGSKSYPIVGVLSFGRGLFNRDPIENGKTSYKYFYRLKANHIVMSQLFGWEGALALSSDQFAGKYLSPQFPTFVTDEAKLYREFLGWFLRRPAFWEDLGSRTSGMGDRRRTLNPEALFACEIPLPPLAEQRRIVAKLNQLAAKIAEACNFHRKTAEEAEAMVRSRADQVFSLIQPRIPIRDDLFDIIYRYPTFYNISFRTEGIGLLKISNLTKESWKIQFEEPHDFISTETNQRFPRTILEAGDIIIAARGATIGKTAYVPPEFSGFNINANLLRLKPKADKLDGKYFWYFMRSGNGQSQFQQVVTSTAKQTITLPRLKSIFVPLPSLEEQRQIVIDLEALEAQVDVLKRLQAETTRDLNALLPSILDKAFKGEL